MTFLTLNNNEVEDSIVTGDISTIIYNLEQMDFTAEDILMRLEEALKGFTFELDTEDGDTITLKGSNQHEHIPSN